MVEGPTATWFRYKDDISTNTIKGLFDLRKNKFGSDNTKTIASLTSGDNKRDEFQVRVFQEEKGGKEITNKVLDFRSEYFREFSNKSFNNIFEQIKRFYSAVNAMFRDKVDYSKLKFLSDPRINSYIHNSTNKQHIIDNLDWHMKLKKLYLKGVDKNGLNKIFATLVSSGIMLESLTLEASVSNSTSSSNQTEFDANNDKIKNFFSKSTCEHLTDLHIINFKIENCKTIFDFMRMKFTYIKKKLDRNYVESNNDDVIIPSGTIGMPYKNISFRKTSATNATTVICLNEAYNFFNDMAKSFGGIDRFKTPFECLDLSGCDCLNLDGLKNLINNFKIIKELNLSGTKYIIYL